MKWTYIKINKTWKFFTLCPQSKVGNHSFLFNESFPYISNNMESCFILLMAA